jgi:hypothetical protein
MTILVVGQDLASSEARQLLETSDTMTWVAFQVLSFSAVRHLEQGKEHASCLLELACLLEEGSSEVALAFVEAVKRTGLQEICFWEGGLSCEEEQRLQSQEVGEGVGASLVSLVRVSQAAQRAEVVVLL